MKIYKSHSALAAACVALFAFVCDAPAAPAKTPAEKTKSAVGKPATARPAAAKRAPAPVKASRLALVIGNADYTANKLGNPVNDARDVAAMLKQSGFEVILRENATLKDMHLALREFGDKLKRETLGLFYFAGHGVQVRGRNFLVGVDADISREDEVAFNALDLQALLEKMDSARNHTNIIILDACRNNPFASRFKLANTGLAQIDAPPGTVVAFSTAPGSVAADGNGRNGLYTKFLLAHLTQPGVRIEDAFKQVRVAVRSESNNRQTPWESTSLENELILKAAPKVKAPAPVKTAASPSDKPGAPRAPQPLGAAPHFMVGDSWEWKITDKLSGEVRTAKRRIESITGEAVTFDNGVVRDPAGNTITEKIGGKVRRYSPSTLFFVYPLTQGLAWGGKMEEEVEDYKADHEIKIGVQGEETLATAMGPMKTIRVERNSTWKSRTGNRAGSSRWTYWYNSAVKVPLKYEKVNMTKDGRVFVHEVHEVVGYQVK
ncbi:MAG: caspase family protein [Betaproteobacteria bacterium]